MAIPKLKPYIRRYPEFEYMAKDFKNKRHLTRDELLRIAEWKLRGRWFPKHKNEIENNSKSKVINITRKAIREADTKTKIEILTNLKGVKIALASAILSVLNPKVYAVIDTNVWYALFEEGKKLSSDDFARYTKIVKQIRREQKLTAREVDMGLFILGKDRRNRRKN